MKYKYKTISQKKKIKDKNIAKILDYIERHAKHFVYSGYTDNKLLVVYDAHFYVTFFEGKATIIIHNEYMELPIKVMADNIVGLMGSLKGYCKN